MAKGGKRKGSSGSKSSAGAAAKLQEDAWAQCDNPNCQKWRRLPPGTLIDEDTPWYGSNGPVACLTDQYDLLCPVWRPYGHAAGIAT